MAVSAQKLLSYEDYLNEGEINLRYDILDGVRVITRPTRQHQRIVGNTSVSFRQAAFAREQGETFVAPCDVLIRYAPLRVRQPDVLFISDAQLAKCSPENVAEPITAAPELVVEVLSPSETRSTREAKIRDYCLIGVKECWVLSPDEQTVEVLLLSSDGENSVAVYHQGETVASVTFPGLTVAVAAIFA